VPVTREAPLRRAIVVLATFLAVLAASARSYADVPTCPELPCSVNRNCSSTGIACVPEDRDCVNRARDRDLEVKCEQQCDEGKTQLVYCPSDTGRSDSNVVWFLLAVAGALAVGGITLTWLMLRKKKV